MNPDRSWCPMCVKLGLTKRQHDDHEKRDADLYAYRNCQFSDHFLLTSPTPPRRCVPTNIVLGQE